ncbi:alpha/beta fold hydrolase [Natrialbaceae archaeon GCM10025810]|uniref:alpha/beta fold hydrolase n=1 Tax=Halovalidus salilacus TaxID=3075124 RepID=UPI00361AC432
METDVHRAVDWSAGVESTVRSVGDVRLHVVAAGDEDDPLVVLLHGFPEFWYGWRSQIDPLVDAGFRVLVPDQRGYNLSEKPESIRAFRTRELSRDVANLIATEGRDAAHVVGHDWGGAVAWDLALRRPEAVDTLAIVNAPHPAVHRQLLASDPEQLLRSWYVFFFQLPVLPELLCRADDFRFLERGMRGLANPRIFGDEELARYRRSWHREGALTAMLNWYRAAARYPPDLPRNRVDAPTLVVWGEDDRALVPAQAVGARQHCPNGRLEMLPGVSHWVQHEVPERLSGLLLEHLDAS